GMGLMLRNQRRTAAVVVSVLGALLITVAGHGYESSGTTPLRYLVAVLPLAAVPIAVWLRALSRRVMALALAAPLILSSIQMAAAYNWRNDKTITQSIAAGVSGWDPSFTFPLLRRTAQPGFDKQSLMVWEVLSLTALAGGFLWRPKELNQSARLRPAYVL